MKIAYTPSPDNSINPSQASEPVKISIQFPTNVYFISGIRDFTLEMVKNLTGFSNQWAFRFQSVVDELCNNAIEHGSAPGEELALTFVVAKNEKIEIYVEDTGTGPNTTTPEALKELYEQKKKQDATQILSIRGRGLSHIIAPLSDEIHFEKSDRGGMKVRVVKYLDNTERL